MANNPSEVGLTEIQNFYHKRGEKLPISLVVSVGSGKNPGAPLGEIDIKSNVLDPKRYADLLSVLAAAVSDRRTTLGVMSADAMVDRLYNTCH